MLSSLKEYSKAEQSDRRMRRMHEHEVFDTIAFAFHYLAEARLTFGGAGAGWLNGLIKEISQFREVRDELLILDVLQPALQLAAKMLDLVPYEYSARLLDTCKALAQRVYDFHVSDLIPLKVGACGDLFKAYNNIACLLIQEGDETQAQLWIQDATVLVRDDQDDADIFLCNTATLIAATSANVEEVQSLLLRAETIVTDVVSMRTQAVEILRQTLASKQAKLETLQNDFLDEVPEQGSTFIVRVENSGAVKMIASIVTETEAEIARIGAQMSAEQLLLQKAHLRRMRTLRKLANFYDRKDRELPGRSRANEYARKLLAAMDIVQNEGGGMPMKDDISNTCVIASFYIRLAIQTNQFERRGENYASCLSICTRAITRIEDAWGPDHTSRRTAELYERGAIIAMLCRQSADLVKEWAGEGLRLNQIHRKGSIYHARALLCLAEAFGFAGDPEQGLISAKDAHRILEDVLGPGHMATKKYNKVWIEHKKVMMKGGGRKAASKIFFGRMDSKQWIRDWI